MILEDYFTVRLKRIGLQRPKDRYSIFCSDRFTDSEFSKYHGIKTEGFLIPKLPSVLMTVITAVLALEGEKKI